MKPHEMVAANFVISLCLQNKRFVLFRNVSPPSEFPSTAPVAQKSNKANLLQVPE